MSTRKLRNLYSTGVKCIWKTFYFLSLAANSNILRVRARTGKCVQTVRKRRFISKTPPTGQSGSSVSFTKPCIGVPLNF